MIVSCRADGCAVFKTMRGGSAKSASANRSCVTFDNMVEVDVRPGHRRVANEEGGDRRCSADRRDIDGDARQGHLKVCGIGTELSTVEVGKLADLIVVAANPLENITNVRRL